MTFGPSGENVTGSGRGIGPDGGGGGAARVGADRGSER